MIRKRDDLGLRGLGFSAGLGRCVSLPNMHYTTACIINACIIEETKDLFYLP